LVIVSAILKKETYSTDQKRQKGKRLILAFLNHTFCKLK